MMVPSDFKTAGDWGCVFVAARRLSADPSLSDTERDRWEQVAEAVKRALGDKPFAGDVFDPSCRVGSR